MSVSGESHQDESIQSTQKSQLNLNSLEDMAPESTSELKVPHMLVSVALEEDQQLPDSEAFSRWICAFPALAKHVTVQGVYKSFSTVLILSIPVVIWNMMHDDPACQPISYITSNNLLDFRKELPLDRSAERTSASTQGSSDSPKSLTSFVAKKAWDEEYAAEPVAVSKFILDDKARLGLFQYREADTREYTELIKRWFSFKEEYVGGSKRSRKRPKSIRRMFKETFSRAYTRLPDSDPNLPLTLPPPPAESVVKNSNHSGSASSPLAKAQFHSESVMHSELENSEVFELPAVEPVGSELSTLIDEEAIFIPGWQLPLSPLPLLFAMSELRDERGEHNAPPKHDTFYNPYVRWSFDIFFLFF
jgi:hypothetical protein